MTFRATLLLIAVITPPPVAPAAMASDPVKIDAAKLGPPKKILVYQGGDIVRERSIAADSREAKAVMDWLRRHEDGWEWSLRDSITSFAPHRYVRGERFSLNFTPGGWCILNYQVGDGDRWQQVIRKLAKDDPIPKVFHAVP